MRIPAVVVTAISALLAAATAQAGGFPFHKQATADPSSSANMQPQNMDCSKLATMQYAAMTVEQCESMKRMAMGSQASMQDPSGARPGDEQMSCADIEAEMHTLKDVKGVSQEHIAAGQQATADLRHTMAKQQAEGTALAAKQTAEVTAAAAADTATEVATGGLVRGRATEAVTRKNLEEQKVVGDRMAKELAPKEQAMFGAANNSMADMNQSMQSNPRFARLVQLAMARQCRE